MNNLEKRVARLEAIFNKQYKQYILNEAKEDTDVIVKVGNVWKIRGR